MNTNMWGFTPSFHKVKIPAETSVDHLMTFLGDYLKSSMTGNEIRKYTTRRAIAAKIDLCWKAQIFVDDMDTTILPRVDIYLQESHLGQQNKAATIRELGELFEASQNSKKELEVRLIPQWHVLTREGFDMKSVLHQEMRDDYVADRGLEEKELANTPETKIYLQKAHSGGKGKDKGKAKNSGEPQPKGKSKTKDKEGGKAKGKGKGKGKGKENRAQSNEEASAGFNKGGKKGETKGSEKGGKI